jgi:hypothetical protein
LNEAGILLIKQVKKNINDTNNIINSDTKNPNYSEIYTNTRLEMYDGPSNFELFFKNKDIQSVHEIVKRLQAVSQDNSDKLNKMLKQIKLEGPPPQNNEAISKLYSDIFIENELVRLQDEISQLNQITETNKVIINMINNKLGYGPLPNPLVNPYPTNRSLINI